MTKEEKLIILNEIKRLIPRHIYICNCYEIARYLPACRLIDGLTTNSMKSNIPELYKEILNEKARTKHLYSIYDTSFIPTSIFYPESSKINDRLNLIDRIINKIKNN